MNKIKLPKVKYIGDDCELEKNKIYQIVEITRNYKNINFYKLEGLDNFYEDFYE